MGALVYLQWNCSADANVYWNEVKVKKFGFEKWYKYA